MKQLFIKRFFGSDKSTTFVPAFRSRFVAVACAMLLVPLVGVQASFAQEWPQRPVRIIVPFPPGGAIDTMTRILAPRLEASLKQPVVVENRAGAGGVVGTEAASRSTDGHTLLMTAMGHVIVPALNKKLSYDPLKDFRALAPVAVVPNVLVVPANSPFKSVQDIIAAAKASPGKLTYGSAGTGSSLHLTPALFAALGDIELTHVPYRGSVAAMTDLVAGRIDMMFDSTTSVSSFVDSGAIRPLAVATSKRSSAYPDVPTVAESGLPQYAVDWWYALLAPRDLPEEALDKVAASVAQSLRDPDIQARFAAIKIEPMLGDTQSLQEAMERDSKKWADLISAVGIQAD